MKKVFCFHCQKDITPLKIWKWQFCPHCFHRTEDNSDGLYLVCDKCGANIPVNSFYCLKCGHGVNGHADNDMIMMLPETKNWAQRLKEIALFVFSIFLAAGILYLSFYFIFIVLAFALVLGLGCFIYSGFSRKKF